MTTFFERGREEFPRGRASWGVDFEKSTKKTLPRTLKGLFIVPHNEAEAAFLREKWERKREREQERERAATLALLSGERTPSYWLRVALSWSAMLDRKAERLAKWHEDTATRGVPRPRCGARTRAGGSCKMKCVAGKKRCRLHGGCSTGPTTAAGRARIAESNRRRALARRSAGA